MRYFKFNTECEGSIRDVISWLQTIDDGFGNVELTFTARFHPDRPLIDPAVALINIAKNAAQVAQAVSGATGYIPAIKAVRNNSKMGLKEAKDFVDMHWKNIGNGFKAAG